MGTSSPFGPGTVGAMMSGVHAASLITGMDLVETVRNGGIVSSPGALAPWPEDFDPLAATRSLRGNGVSGGS